MRRMLHNLGEQVFGTIQGMAREGVQHRLFVAAYPPEGSRRAMLRALDKLHPPPDQRHRRTPLAQVHMTLQFIGPATEREVEQIVESVERSAAGVAAVSLSPRRLITLPEARTPRLIALETDAPPGLLEIQRRLAQRLARSPRPGSRQRFRPHLTLCRFTGSAKPSEVEQPVSIDPFDIEHIVLVRSVLRPEGAEHFEVARVELDG